MRVLQVNVRLSEGGAAGVARTLAEELPKLGIQAGYAYGFGRRAGPSPMASAYGATRLTGRVSAVRNFGTERVLGRELSLGSRSTPDHLRAVLHSVDVVHLHAVHSFMIPFEQLERELIRAGKPVVWTAHDEWLLTGRCAQPGTCNGWLTGCSPCQDRSAYPSAWLDTAARGYTRKRLMMSRLEAALPVAIVACAQWLGDRLRVAGFRNVITVHNSVDASFWSAVRPRHRHDGPQRVVFMCRDLRDRHKVDVELLCRIASLPDLHLTVIGDHAPPALAAVATVVPAISDRSALAAVLQDNDTLVFTSLVDYFPLTIAEALVAGCRVVALRSPASTEMAQLGPVTTVATNEELLQVLCAGPSPAPSAAGIFAPDRMAGEYADLYASILPAK